MDDCTAKPMELALPLICTDDTDPELGCSNAVMQ